jgi:hypothetical protein
VYCANVVPAIHNPAGIDSLGYLVLGYLSGMTSNLSIYGHLLFSTPGAKTGHDCLSNIL